MKKILLTIMLFFVFLVSNVYAAGAGEKNICVREKRVFAFGTSTATIRLFTKDNEKYYGIKFGNDEEIVAKYNESITYSYNDFKGTFYMNESFYETLSNNCKETKLYLDCVTPKNYKHMTITGNKPDDDRNCAYGSEHAYVDNGFTPVQNNLSYDSDYECTIGNRVLNDLKGVLNIFRIIAPIVCIAFTIFDIVKAVANGNINEQSKKLGKTTMMRIIYTVLLFFIPTLVITLFSLFDNNADCVREIDNPDKLEVDKKHDTSVNNDDNDSTSSGGNNSTSDNNNNNDNNTNSGTNSWNGLCEGVPIDSCNTKYCTMVPEHNPYGTPVCQTACYRLPKEQCNRWDCEYSPVPGSGSTAPSCHKK